MPLSVAATASAGDRDARKATRPKIIRAAVSLLLPLAVAATVLQSNVAPAVAGSVVSLCLAFPLIQLLQMLDPKSGDKLASAIDVTRVFRAELVVVGGGA